MSELRRRTATQVFVDDLEQPVLGADELHHLARVLRLRDGELVGVSDGRGGWRPCRYRTGGQLESDGPIVVEPAPTPALTVAFAPAKGDRPEWVVQKLTELGIDRIVPVITARSVVTWDGDRAAKAHRRLQRVALDAAAQSRRVHLPEVLAPVGFNAFVEQHGPIRLAEPGGTPPRADGVPVLVGPEGGFTDPELARAGDPTDPSGRVGLPGGILRAETAALALGVLLSAARDIRAGS